jgi:hypothetical protein
LHPALKGTESDLHLVQAPASDPCGWLSDTAHPQQIALDVDVNIFAGHPGYLDPSHH